MYGLELQNTYREKEYMLTKKKDAVELLQQYKVLFASIFNKECTIKFDMHTSNSFIVTDIIRRNIGDVENKPDKSIYEGKNRSPMLFEVANNQAPLLFTFDDTVVSPLSNGVRLTVTLDEPLNGKQVIEVDIRLT